MASNEVTSAEAQLSSHESPKRGGGGGNNAAKEGKTDRLEEETKERWGEFEGMKDRRARGAGKMRRES